MTEQAIQPQVVHNEQGQRYEVWVGDAVAGFSEYRDQGRRRVFTHTEVDDAYAGQGLGKVLAASALDDVVRHGLVIVPLCPFIAGYLRKHEEYAEHVYWPGGEG
ncbi:GNAT family N-acetyltransferase [Saccharomonospora sp. NPDC046836]|uniref:GNAT family N-acetyltransferase n=1 Tax=Saccharomonospora sp. NPDC046836 TaxID=3156921 RepID=UPI0033E866DF